MNSILHPLHTKDARIIVIGKSKHSGKYGTIIADCFSNYQTYFRAKLDDGTRVNLHAESLQIANTQTFKKSEQ